MDRTVSNFVVKALHTEDELALLQKTVDQFYVDQDWDISWEQTKLYGLLDPDCYIVGMLDGEIVSSVCAINWSDNFSLIIAFITRSDLRGKGYGAPVFEEALKHTGDRKVCLFAAPGMASIYAKHGFVASSIGGLYMMENAVHSATSNSKIVPAVEVPIRDLADFDSRFFPARRETFLEAFIREPGNIAYTYLEDDGIKGYGMVQSSAAFKGAWIGPLFATEFRVAKELTDALLASDKDIKTVYFEIFEQNTQALKLVEELGLKPVVPFDIMYRNGVPEYDKNGAYSACIF